MTLNDLVKNIAETVKESIQDAVDAISKKYDGRIVELENQIKSISSLSLNIDDTRPMLEAMVNAIEVPKGQDGSSPSADDVAKAMEHIFAKWALDFERKADGYLERAIERMPKPKDGASVTADDVQPMIKELVQAAVAEIPAAKDGASVTADDVQPMIKELVQAAVAEIPAAKDGVSPSLEEIVKASQDVLLGKHSQWLLDRERIENDRIEKRLSEIPKPADGKDAFQLEDFDVHYSEDSRELTLKFAREGSVIERNIKIPSIIDKGVFREDGNYEKGDAVTFGGSLYIVQKNSPEGKPGQSDSFRLAVKRGRDGKEVVKTDTSVKTVKIGGHV